MLGDLARRWEAKQDAAPIFAAARFAVAPCRVASVQLLTMAGVDPTAAFIRAEEPACTNSGRPGTGGDFGGLADAMQRFGLTLESWFARPLALLGAEC